MGQQAAPWLVWLVVWKIFFKTMLVIGGLEYLDYFPLILGIVIIPTDFIIFFRWIMVV
jgi:hypothetical protein